MLHIYSALAPTAKPLIHSPRWLAIALASLSLASCSLTPSKTGEGPSSFSVMSSKIVSSGEPEFEVISSGQGRVAVALRVNEGTGGSEDCGAPVAKVTDHKVSKTTVEVFIQWKRRGCKPSWRRFVFDFAWGEATAPFVNWHRGPEAECVSYQVQKAWLARKTPCSNFISGKLL